MRELIVDKGSECQRLNKYLGKYLDAAPQSFIYKMLRKKNIKYNGVRAAGDELLKSGDIIQIFMSDDTISNFQSSVTSINETCENEEPLKDIQILYEDKDIIILNKPAGVLSQKARPDDYSLNEQIIDHYYQRDEIDDHFTPSVCNRLDRNTSGIILGGMSYQGTRILSKMLKERTLTKYYLTIVKGSIDKPRTIKGYLTKNEAHNRVVIYSDIDEAKKAGIDNPAYIETRYIPLGHGKVSDGRREYTLTLLKVELVTGKTHQIRAHLKSIGNPIIGDGKYGHKDINAYFRKEYGLKHQLLHAYEIIFPDNNETLSGELSGKIIVAKLPAIFENIKDDLIIQ